MELAEQDIQQAARGDKAAIERVLRTCYPTVRRMAYGLTGEHAGGRRVVREVMLHAVAQVRRWQDAEAVQRWFVHHTVLTARQNTTGNAGRDLRKDTLVGAAADVGYAAFIRALRQLPLQQKEAFLLHVGEDWWGRDLGIAMDSATGAADMHLRSAENVLRPLGGNAYAELVERLAAAYQALTPPEQETRLEIQHAVRTRWWPRLLAGCGCLTLLVLAAGAAAAWWWWPAVSAWLQAQGWR